MKRKNNIPTLDVETFKLLMSSFDPFLYSKRNLNDFLIYDFSDSLNRLKLPLPQHRFIANSVLFVTNGSINITLGLDNYIVGPNSIFVILAGQIISVKDISNDIKGFYLHFTTDFLAQPVFDFSDWLISPIINFKTTEIKHLTRLLKRMDKLNKGGENSALIKQYLVTFLSEIQHSFGHQARNNITAPEKLTREFKRLLSFNVKKEKTVLFYAKKLNVTPNHLNKCTKTTLGKSASSLIDEMLLLESKVLMRQNKMSISEVAFEIGFEDPSYFGRFFKKHSGQTPNEFCKMIDLSE